MPLNLNVRPHNHTLAALHMDQDKLGKSADVREKLETALNDAIAEVNSMSFGAERSRHLCNLASLLVGQAEELRASAFSLCPEPGVAEPYPDTRLEHKEEELAAKLTTLDLELIDEALLHNSSSSWRKVARVIGSAMVALDGQVPRLAVGVYVRRIGALVQCGSLLAEGNIKFMRLSKVKLPAVGARVA